VLFPILLYITTSLISIFQFLIFFCFFGKNDLLRENSQDCVPKVFIATPIDMLCSNFVKFD